MSDTQNIIRFPQMHKVKSHSYSKPFTMPAQGSLARLAGESYAIAPAPSFIVEETMAKCFFAMAVSAMMLAVLLLMTPRAYADARLKDIVAFEGVRDNLLMGYGLVVGLNGTGDKLKNNEFTSQSLIAFLERQGVNTRGTELKSKNIAAVTVTATLPPFARSGGKINVSVSAMGDAKSLQGGILLATAMYGADGQVYAVAQGPVSISTIEATPASPTPTSNKGVPTNGFIADGGIVEKEIHFALNEMSSINIGLRNPDISTAKNVAASINKHLGVDAASAIDPGTVHLRIPLDYKNNTTGLLAEIELLPVKTDQVAKVVIDEASGTVVMGENVRIDTVAVSQGNLVIKVAEAVQVNAATGTETATVVNAPGVIGEPGRNFGILQHGATLRELVSGLSALGVGPRDLITILQTIKAAGALQAEIITR